MSRHSLNRRIDSMEVMTQKVSAWHSERDALVARVIWRFTTEDAGVRLKQLYPTFVG